VRGGQRGRQGPHLSPFGAFGLMNFLVAFFENLFYRPRWYHWVVAFLLLPFSLLYGWVMRLRRALAKLKDLGLPVVSVGNLKVGGSGKTPVTIALAKRYEKPAVVLRGYGRQSRGLVVVSEWGRVMADVYQSGDEAMELARALPKATVIVAEKREEGIAKARTLGAEAVFLDDGFSKVGIKKFDILLCAERLPNRLVLPAGPLREFYATRERADLRLVEGRDFTRQVTCVGCEGALLLVTAVADPSRLEPFLPKDRIAGRLVLPDHAWFERAQVEEAMKRSGAQKILATRKDAVKLEALGFEPALLALEIELSEAAHERIRAYITGYNSASKTQERA